MQRGDVVIVSASGDYGKPRPAVILQSNLFEALVESLTVCPITSDVQDAPLIRITVEPTAQNGLRRTSQIMVDKIQTLSRKRIGSRIGRLEEEPLLAVERAIALFLGLAD